MSFKDTTPLIIQIDSDTIKAGRGLAELLETPSVVSGLDLLSVVSPCRDSARDAIAKEMEHRSWCIAAECELGSYRGSIGDWQWIELSDFRR